MDIGHDMAFFLTSTHNMTHKKLMWAVRCYRDDIRSLPLPNVGRYVQHTNSPSLQSTRDSKRPFSVLWMRCMVVVDRMGWDLGTKRRRGTWMRMELGWDRDGMEWEAMRWHGGMVVWVEER